MLGQDIVTVLDCYKLLTASATWMIRCEFCQIPDLAVNNNPAVVGIVMLRDLLRGEQSMLGHDRGSIRDSNESISADIT